MLQRTHSAEESCGSDQEHTINTQAFGRPVCAVALGLSLSSGALGSFTATASTVFIWRNSSFVSNTGGPSVPGGSIIPGSTGAGSMYAGSFANSSFGYSFASSALQEYAVFHGSATVQANREQPGATFESFQSFATGTFTEMLTIPSPAGVAFGSMGTVQFGWDVTGTTTNSGSGFASMGIFAHTSASLPQTSSNTESIFGNGHFDLANPIAFLYDTPFLLTIESSVFAGVGYDYRFSPPPPSFSESAAADFLHTAVLTTAVVRDASGAIHPEATFTTGSGRQFPVPAPGAMGVAAIALVGASRRRRR